MLRSSSLFQRTLIVASILTIAAPRAHAQDVRDTTAKPAAGARITNLKTITVEERAKYDALKADIDQRRRAGFGYWADSVQFAKVFTVGQALNFPGVHVQTKGADWSIYMTGMFEADNNSTPPTAIATAPAGRTGAKATGINGPTGPAFGLTCNPTWWLDGMKSDVMTINDIRKEEIAVVELYNSAARAPLKYTGSGSNCGVVLVWRKRYISPQ